MPKTQRKTKTISISLPIELDNFLNKVVESEMSKKACLTKSALITMIIEMNIADFQQEQQRKAQEKPEA